jgi:hypothetical protein
MLAGDGVVGAGKVEEDFVVFGDGGPRVFGEVELEGAGELGSVYTLFGQQQSAPPNKR